MILNAARKSEFLECEECLRHLQFAQLLNPFAKRDDAPCGRHTFEAMVRKEMEDSIAEAIRRQMRALIDKGAPIMVPKFKPFYVNQVIA